MRAFVTSIPATFTIPRARPPTVTLAARSSLAAIGMTSRHGIFPLTVVAPNAKRIATVCLKQMPAAGVLAVGRLGCGRSSPSCQRIRLHGEETCLIRVSKAIQHEPQRVCQDWTSRSFTAVRLMTRPNKSPSICKQCRPLKHLAGFLRQRTRLHCGPRLSK